MSDPVAIAIISGVSGLATAVTALLINRKLNAIQVSVNGRLQQLLDSQTKGARAEGNLEGRAELHEENRVDNK